MRIQFLTVEAIDSYRALRLSALQESPTAFGSSYEEEVDLPLSHFAARLRSKDGIGGIFGAWDEADRLVGMLGFSREERLKYSHVGSLWSFYVLPELRGNGVGAALLDRVIEQARSVSGLQQIRLIVTATNLAAIALYRSRGFERFGFERNSMCVNGSYFDVEHLVLYLHSF